MKRKRPAGVDMNVTSPIDVTFGAFHIGEYRVPYLNSVLKAKQAEEYLSLVTEDPKYANHDWKIEELFQREVSYGRVLDIANNYLNPDKANRSPFFNSLTIVLVPKELEDDQTYSAPPIDDEYDHSLEIGPISVSYDQNDASGDYPAPKTFGVLRWNRDEIYGVAIDGQHRLAAIKHLCNNNPSTSQNLYISIIFLIIDKRMGFLTPTNNNFDNIKYMRSIFIDLNKHAEPVSRARNLLLDDFDPMALFVKSLLAPSLKYDQTDKENDYGLELGMNGEFETCMPLDLIDWHSEAKSKVDDGPYATSILGLDWIVQKVLSKCNHPKTKPINISKLGPDDDNYYEKLKKLLKDWGTSWDASIKDHLKECEENEKAFNLSVEDLENLQNEFKENWGRPITRLLTGTACYSDLARKRIDDDLISPQFGQWFQLKSSTETAQLGHEKNYYQGRLEAVEETLKNEGISIKKYKESLDDIENEIKNNRILFYLVGQRALVLAFVDLLNKNKIVSWSNTIDVEYTDCVNDFCAYYLVEAINELHSVFTPGEDEFFEKTCEITEENYQDGAEDVRKEFWAASLTKRENPSEMDFSEIAAKRASKWFVFIAHLYWFLKCNSDESIDKEWILSLVDDISPVSILPMGEELSQAIGGLTTEGSVNDAPMKFLIGGFVDNPDDHADLIKLAAKERIGYLCDLFIESGILQA